MSNNTPERLREVVLTELIKQVEEGPVVVLDGEPTRVSPPAALFTAAIAFLKQFPPMDLPQPGEVGATLRKYAEKMPFKS